MANKILFTLIIVVFGINLYLPKSVYAVSTIPATPSLPTVTSSGNTYHVNKTTGSNSYTKSQASNPATPWSTIQYGINQLTAGDTLLVNQTASPYDECLNISKIGMENNWITITGNGKPIIRCTTSGLKTVDFQRTANAYIAFRNFTITSTTNAYAGILVRAGNHHMVFDSVEITGVANGIILGEADNDLTDTADKKAGASYIYFNNCQTHNNQGDGFSAFRQSHDIVLDHCSSYSNGGNGFRGHNALAGNTYVNIGPPDNPLDTMYNFYFLNSVSYSNTDDGFDFGVMKGLVMYKNSIAHHNGTGTSVGQGVGFKSWGDNTWLINVLAYHNKSVGINIAPLWDNSQVNIIHSTFVLNSETDFGGQIYGEEMNGSYTLKSANVHLVNSILYGGQTSYGNAILLRGLNVKIVEENNNYYYSKSNTIAFEQRQNTTTILKQYRFKDMQNSTWTQDTGLGTNNIARTQATDILQDPGFTNASSDMYSLLSSSLAVDKGISVGVNDDISGLNRPQGNGFDIGAYELVSGTTPTAYPSPAPSLQPTATPNIKPGDANGDGKVDETDYGIWLSHFGQTVTGGKTVGDFNADGRVDGVDYVVWLNNYGS